MKGKKSLMVVSLALSMCLTINSMVFKKEVRAYESPQIVSKVYTDKSRYNPLDTVNILIELNNMSASSFNGNIVVTVLDKNNVVYEKTMQTTLKSSEKQIKQVSFIPPNKDFKGYLVKVKTNEEDYKTTAIDVSSNWSKYPRYGYIPNFDNSISKNKSDESINTLCNEYYLNAFQFYDWMWRHEVPIKRTNGVVDSNWKDLFSRDIQLNVIQNYINSVHAKNAKAMAYMMSYAAREEYEKFGLSNTLGVFEDKTHSKQLNVNFNNGKYLWLFAPSNPSWQNFIVNAYKDSINSLGFDGIQMDQMGQRNEVYDYLGNNYDLENSFASLINYTKTALNSNNPSKSYVDFNIVDGATNGWAVKNIAKNANTDFNFSEIWWKSNNYNDLKNYIQQVRKDSSGKALVLAAYMNYNENTGFKIEAEDSKFYGVNFANNHPGFTGRGFLENFYKVGDYVEFTVNIDNGMTYPLVFQYGNNSDFAKRTLYVDGIKMGKVNFYPKGTWDKFDFDALASVNLSQGIHKIKLSYDSDDNGAINIDSLTLGLFNDSSIKLTDAVMAASGATHIELGAGVNSVAMLAHEYYPNNSKEVSRELQNSLKEYYKFITAYENLLFDKELIYGDSGNQYVNIENEYLSGDGKKGSIYHINRANKDYEIMHLINLSSETDELWRNSTTEPNAKWNLKTKYYFPKGTELSGVYLASPDINKCESISLDYTIGEDEIGTYVKFNVPALYTWDMIYIKRNIPISSGSMVYEGEDAIKTNVGVNKDHMGYSGTGFVDKFGEVGDEVTFRVNVADSKDYNLKFKYGNATGSNATRHVYIDGQYAGTLNMGNLPNWDSWNIGSINTYLESGVHTICLYFDSSDKGAINLDNLSLN